MRCGQILSMDALVSLVLIIMILGTVSAASDNLRSDITSMLGWYERANIADNMLDVLTKSQGVPEDWEDDVNSLVVPGLKSSEGNYLDYSKIMALIESAKTGNPILQSALWNLSGHHNFNLAIFVPNQSVTLAYNYTVSNAHGAGLLTACNVGELGNSSDSPVLINASQCSNGEFDFTHDFVSFDSYYNPYYVCVQGNTKIGDNFTVTVGQYLAVNGSLNVGSDGWLYTSAIYVTGDAYIGSSGYATNITDDSYIGGDFIVNSSGNAIFGKNLYVYGSTTVESTGYLTVGGSLYSLGQLDVQSNGNVNVSNDLYVGDDATVGNSGNLWVGSNLFVNGSLNGQSSLKIYVGGTAFVNGSLSLPSGTLRVGDALYVNGNFSQSPDTTVDVYGDAFINGDLSVEGTNTFHRDLHVNGDLTVDSDEKLVVYGNLYVSGKLTVRGTLIVYGNVYEYYNTQPPIELASGKTFHVNGWLYTMGDTWYAMNGTGTNPENYSFSGYRYNLTAGGWENRNVSVGNNEILLGYYTLDYIILKGGEIIIVRVRFYKEFEMMSINWNFDIQINGTGSLALPPDKDDAFAFNPPSLLMPPAPEFQYPECKASEQSSVVIDVKSVNVTYKFSPEEMGWENISMISETFMDNPDTVGESMDNSTWIQHAERTVLVSYKVYKPNYTLTGDGKVLLYEGKFPWTVVGGFNLTLPDSDGNLTLVSAFSTEEYVGYTVMVVVENDSRVYYGLVTVFPEFNYTGTPGNCKVQRIGDSLIVPMKCFVPFSSNVGEGITFSLWMYHNTFPQVKIEDVGDIGAVMQPVYHVAILKLWVWGE